MSQGNPIRDAERLIGAPLAAKMLLDYKDKEGKIARLHFIGWRDLWEVKKWTYTGIHDQIKNVDDAISKLKSLKNLDSNAMITLSYYYLSEHGWPSRSSQSSDYLDPHAINAHVVFDPILKLRDHYERLSHHVIIGQHGNTVAAKAIALKSAIYWTLTTGNLPSVGSANNRSDWAISVFKILHQLEDGNEDPTGWVETCYSAISELKAENSALFKELKKIRRQYEDS